MDLRRLLIAILVCAVPVCCFAQAAGPDVSGNWVSSSAGCKTELQVEQKGDQISGVVNVECPLGQKAPYHFKGSIRDGAITANHSLGHTFRGRLHPDGKLVGRLITQNNEEIPVEATRAK